MAIRFRSSRLLQQAFRLRLHPVPSSLDSVPVDGCFGDGDSCFSDSSAERSPAPPNHTMLSGFDDGLAATLQRMSPAISATCASAIRTTFRQKRAFRGISAQHNDQHCLAEGIKAASSRRTPKRAFAREIREIVSFRFCFGGDTDLGDSRALQCVHHSDQFLHRQIAIGSNHNGDIRIRLF